MKFENLKKTFHSQHHAENLVLGKQSVLGLFAFSAKRPKMTEASSLSTPDELLVMSGGRKLVFKRYMMYLFSFNSFLIVYKGCELN